MSRGSGIEALVRRPVECVSRGMVVEEGGLDAHPGKRSRPRAEDERENAGVDVQFANGSGMECLKKYTVDRLANAVPV